METVRIKSSFISKAKSVLMRTLTIGLPLAFLVIIGDGYFEDAALMLRLAFFGSLIFEGVTAQTFVLRSDALRLESRMKTRKYRFDRFKIERVKGKHSFTVTDRQTSKSETLECRGFGEKEFLKLVEELSKRQRAYSLGRSSSVGRDSDAAASRASQLRRDEPEQLSIPLTPDEKRVAELFETAHERNPYAKKNRAKEHEKPAVNTPTVELPAPKIEPEKPKIDPITIAATLPEIKAEIVSKAVNPNAHLHDHSPPPPAEEFVTFRYPRRNVIDDAERRSVLTILTILTVGVAVLLMLALSIPVGVVELLTLAAICGGLVAIVIARRVRRTSKLPSKIEVGTQTLIIDNDRYRIGKISDFSATPAIIVTGMRRIRFDYGGKTVVCSLGPAKRPRKGRRADEYFDRYPELVKLLKVRIK